MGYMRHNAIIVTGWEVGQVSAARGHAIELGMSVTEVVTSPINAYWTFLIAPDGSKEGWEGSNEGDAQRDAFVEFLERPPSEGLHFRVLYALDWVEVILGDEDGPAREVRSRVARASGETEEGA